MALCKIKFDSNNELHFDIIYSYYYKLTGVKKCVQYGNHWKEIGFQDTDPSTDFRGLGMLGPL